VIKQLIAHVTRRVELEVTEKSSLGFLKEQTVENYINSFISTLYLYTRNKKGENVTIYFAELVCAIGHSVRNKLKLKKESGNAARLGAFLLYSLQDLKAVEVVLGKGYRGHNAYIVNILNDDMIVSFWSSLSTRNIEKLPKEEPYKDWESVKHECGAYLIKTGAKDVIDEINPETHPIIFECINRSQKVGWRINKTLYDLHGWALRNKTKAFSDIWTAQSQEAKATKLREAKAIGDIAKRFLNKTFYHLYSYDFRGRKYCNTAYLHEQGTDLARGLLLRADKAPITKEGFFWLLVSIANNYAGNSGREDNAKTDKIPLKERYLWSLDNEDVFLSYAESPKTNTRWMEADKPWQFLAGCIELMNIRIYQYERNDFEDYSYPTSLEVYLDGSNNGSQHLTALTKDEITAPHVNLVPSELPGDLYAYVANHVWSKLDQIVKELSEEDRERCEQIIDNLIDLKKQITEAEPKSDRRKELVEKIRQFKLNNEAHIIKAAPLYWYRVKDSKHKRKIVKRGVMTIPYGGTPFGLGEQVIDDAKKHGIELLKYLEHRYGAYMGRLIFEDCKDSLKRPMQLLSVFEKAGKAAEERGEFLCWTVPLTNFPVIQYYKEGVTKKVWVNYGPNRGVRNSNGYYENALQISICFVEDTVMSKGKQAQGAAPNAIHSLDAAHLALTVYKADFPVTTIHDSFGCLPGDMPKLFKLLRETFIELYKSDPLSALSRDMQCDISNIVLGNLDLDLILESEYCFS